MTPSLLPKSQLKLLFDIQDKLLVDVLKSLRSLDSILIGEINKIIPQLKTASPTRIRFLVARAMKKYEPNLMKYTLKLIDNAQNYAKSYIDTLEKYNVNDLKTIPKGQYNLASKNLGGSAAKAAIAYSKSRLKSGKIFSTQGKIDLSKRLHRLNNDQIKRISDVVIEALQGAKEMRLVAKEIAEIDKIKKLRPAKNINKLAQETARLEKVLGPKDKSILAAKKYLKKLRGGGRVQSAYVQLIKKIESGKPVQQALKNFGQQKQRSYANLILKEEANAAFRQAQIEEGKDKDYIIGYRVNLDRFEHARYRKRAGKKKGGGKLCICESYNGKFISKEDYEIRWNRGFHPHCQCAFTEVLDRDKLFG